MGNDQYKAIFSQKADAFLAAYRGAREIYKYGEKDDRCYHNGEFGRARELALRKLLKDTVCRNLGVSEGFVLNHANGRTTQCDVVIHDHRYWPLEDGNTGANFFTAETVASIGEVKSILSFSKLREALLKLARNKGIRDSYSGSYETDIRTGKVFEFDTSKHHTVSIFSFLVCERIDGFGQPLLDKMVSAYEQDGIAPYNRHNLILSLEDGLITYDGKALSAKIGQYVKTHPYPSLYQQQITSEPMIIVGSGNGLVIDFLINLANSLENTHMSYPEPIRYLKS